MPDMHMIDFHGHIVPEEFPAPPRGADAADWPSMQAIDDTNAQMLVGDRPFRAFSSFYWDVDRRAEQLTQHDTGREVISPLPELLSYWLTPGSALAITDFMNDTIAAMVAARPDRFSGFGGVVLQDSALAVRQIAHMRASGLSGLLVGSHVNGVSIADPSFYPVFEAAEALELPVLVHGIKPAWAKLAGPPPMPVVLGVPQETAMAIGAFIMSDILGCFPKLKLVFAHGGGTIGSMIERLDVVWAGRAQMQAAQPMRPSAYLKRFYFDTAVFSPLYLAYLKDLVGTDRLVAGTDGPVDHGQPAIADFLATAGLTADEQAQVGFETGQSLLKLSAKD